jgi:hypothetical protein
VHAGRTRFAIQFVPPLMRRTSIPSALLAAAALTFPASTSSGGSNPVARAKLGASLEGREIVVAQTGRRDAAVRVLVVGCIHGNECAGTAITDRLVRVGTPAGTGIWVVKDINPDGSARRIRQNARGVDLNRNFGSEWKREPRHLNPFYPGPRPWSEPETRIARRLIERIRPAVTIWYHQSQNLVRAWGPSVPAARRYARLVGMRYRSWRWPPGTASNWQNHRFAGSSSFVVELPGGRLSQRAIRRHAEGILRLTAMTTPQLREHVRWRRSLTLGLPDRGRLVHGVRLPSEGVDHFTWDPVLKRRPNRAWRRWGSDRLVRVVLRVIRGYARTHPYAPRLGIGDLSRPHGGDFGARWGGLGHVSHQNGLDVDVFYPRLDGRERPPLRVAQIDRRLAQELVDRFVRAGAVRIFVGPNTGLVGPPRIVRVLPHHDNHLHVRIGPG